MQCKLCNRDAGTSGLCEYHGRAHGNLLEAYEKWRSAYGELTWIAYLHRLVDLEEAGLWVKEVARMHLKVIEGEA